MSRSIGGASIRLGRELPRPIPWTLRAWNVFGGWSQLAFGFLLFVTPFFWLFVMEADLPWLTFRGEKQYVEGSVTAVDTTAGSENGQEVYAVHFDYLVERELPHSGVSYSTGWAPQVGETVGVEYLVNRPEKARIEEMRLGMWGPAVLFVLIFPAIALGIAWFLIRRALRTNRILRRGIRTDARLLAIGTTNTTVNGKPLRALHFEFKRRSGKPAEAEVRTLNARIFSEGETYPILYDPGAPAQALAIPLIELDYSTDDTGALKGRPLTALLSMLLPTVLVLANGLFAMAWWS